MFLNKLLKINEFFCSKMSNKSLAKFLLIGAVLIGFLALKRIASKKYDDEHLSYQLLNDNYKNSMRTKSGYLSGCLNNVTFVNRFSVWTLLADDDEYAKSAVKLLRSIQLNTDMKFDANVLEQVNKPLRPELRRQLIEAGWSLCLVERIPPRDSANAIPRYKDTFTKLSIWRMIEYESVVLFVSEKQSKKKILFIFRGSQ